MSTKTKSSKTRTHIIIAGSIFVIALLVFLNLETIKGWVNPGKTGFTDINLDALDTREGFYQTPDTTTANTVPPSNTTAQQSLTPEQKALCPKPLSLVRGFRSLYSGATFKMEQIAEGNTTEYFICGPGKFVVMRTPQTNSLQLSIRDTSRNIVNQIFIKQEKDNPAGGSKCIVFMAKDSSGLYVQYEHEHLSIRPLNTDGKPFMGQCFVEYNVPESELSSNALALGISVARLGNDELYGSGYNRDIAVPEGSLDMDTQDALAGEADKKTESALASIVSTLNDLKQKLGGTQPTQSVFGAGGPLQINLDVSGMDAEKETFQDMAAGSGTASVRQLLDQYDGSTMQLGGVPAIGELPSSRKMLEIRQALQSKFKGCPNIDRNKYYSERQLAQCSGCNPDAFLRGQLGGVN